MFNVEENKGRELRVHISNRRVECAELKKLVEVILRDIDQEQPASSIVLSFIGCEIGWAQIEELVKVIEKAPCPITLNLNNNRIGIKSVGVLVEAIKEARVSVTLSLEHNRIEYREAVVLGYLVKVAEVPVTLYLGDNNIGNEEAIVFSEYLKEAQVFNRLNLGNNFIGDKGAVALGDALKVVQTPVMLSLSCDAMSFIGVMALGKAIEMAHVSLWLNLWGRIDSMGRIALLKGVKAARVPATLNLNGEQIGRLKAELLLAQEEKAIEENVSTISIGEDEIRCLECIEVGFFRKVLKKLKVPVRIFLSLSNFVNAWEPLLLSIMEEVRSSVILDLVVPSSRIINDYTEDNLMIILVECLKKAKAPVVLDLKNSSIGDIGAIILSEFIQEAKVPITINLFWNDIGFVGAMALGRAIELAHVPLCLYFWDNSIGSIGKIALYKGMKATQVPVMVNLCGKQIDQSEVEWLLAQEESAIKENTSVIDFDLGKIKCLEFLEEGLFCNMLKESQVPVRCSLFWDNLVDKWVEFLSCAIKEARKPIILKLRVLDLSISNNDIRDRIKIGLMKCIKAARVSVTLDLRNSSIGDEEVIALVECIGEAQNSMRLDLKNNTIGDAGAITLAEYVKKGRVSVMLDLSNNRIGQMGEIALAEAQIVRHFFPSNININNLGLYDAFLSYWKKARSIWLASVLTCLLRSDKFLYDILPNIIRHLVPIFGETDEEQNALQKVIENVQYSIINVFERRKQRAEVSARFSISNPVVISESKRMRGFSDLEYPEKQEEEVAQPQEGLAQASSLIGFSHPLLMGENRSGLLVRGIGCSFFPPSAPLQSEEDQPSLQEGFWASIF